MARNGHGRPRQPWGRTFVSCLRDFLTPEVWKQAHKAAGKKSRAWTVQPLVLVLLSMTWCLGDSQAERFEVARGFCVTLLPKRRRPGKTVKGFQQALARLPMAVFDALKTALRRRLLQVLEPALRTDGFIPLGCDGTRLLCPRVNALEKCMGQSARADTPPQMWVTAIVHLTTGLLWSWRAGPGDSSERNHLATLLSTLPALPALALVVTDAGYPSFELAKAMAAQNVCFLMRVSSNMTFYLDHKLDAPVEAWQEGEVYWWPHEVRETKQRPLKVRLIQVKGRKHPVWLITNVFEAERLSLPTASRFYKLRWENEGFFRSFKRTLGKVKLTCRTEALVYREAEGSLLATQLLQAQGVHALAACEHKQAKNSLRQLILLVRDEMYGRSHGKAYSTRLRATIRENRVRTSVKEKRIWPSRKPHKALPAPNLRVLAPHERTLLYKRLSAT